MTNHSPSIPFVFFGTDQFSIGVLDELEHAGLLPTLIVTAPARKAGRGMQLREPTVKEWADARGIEVLQPEKLDTAFCDTLEKKAPQGGWSLFLLASYGLIVPKSVLEIPKNGMLNVHPSLLPTYRGASPIQTQILNNETRVGVTIMLMDEEMDHGPLIAEQELSLKPDTLNAGELSVRLREEGGKLLAKIIPEWIKDGKATPQEHKNATFTKKIQKSDGEIKLTDEPLVNYRKYLAYSGWPGVFFFENGKRVKVTQATFEDGAFTIKRVIPEGRREMSWEMYTNMPKQK